MSMILDMDWNETSNLCAVWLCFVPRQLGLNMAHKLVSFGAYDKPTCDSRPSD